LLFIIKVGIVVVDLQSRGVPEFVMSVLSREVARLRVVADAPWEVAQRRLSALFALRYPSNVNAFYVAKLRAAYERDELCAVVPAGLDVEHPRPLRRSDTKPAAAYSAVRIEMDSVPAYFIGCSDEERELMVALRLAISCALGVSPVGEFDIHRRRVEELLDAVATNQRGADMSARKSRRVKWGPGSNERQDDGRIVTLYMSGALDRAIDAAAAQHNQTRSAFVRMVLERDRSIKRVLRGLKFELPDLGRAA